MFNAFKQPFSTPSDKIVSKDAEKSVRLLRVHRLHRLPLSATPRMRGEWIATYG